MLKIYRCNIPQHHDSFLEMLDMWEERGYVETEYVGGHVHWADKEETFLLWHWPRVDEPWRRVPPFKIGLFGNVVPNHPQCIPWTFFARSPKRLDKIVNNTLPTYNERNITSIFMGKVENQIQAAGRNNQDWSTGIDDFYMSQGSPGSYKYTKEEYLVRLSHAKFGLTLPGYGPKCNRDIELMGVGTVPIVGPGCDVVKYDEPWIENIHYIKVNNPSEIRDKISSVTKSKWEEMHNECRMWYNRNASTKGSFELTKKLIEKYK